MIIAAQVIKHIIDKNFFDFIVTSGLVWTYDSDIIVTEKECFGNKGDK